MSEIDDSGLSTLTYILDSYTDRERLYTQYEMLREDFNDSLERALRLGNLPGDSQTATWHALDVGCGEGLFSAEIAGRYPLAHVVGFDKDPNAIATAGQVFGSSKNLQFFVHDALQPLPREWLTAPGQAGEPGFDLAIAHIVLLHLRQPGAALANIHAALKPGGVVYLCDSTAERLTFPHPSLAALCAVMAEAVRRVGTPDFSDRHAEYLAEAGFVDIESWSRTYELGGPTAGGQRRLLNLVSALISARRGIVEGLRLIDGEAFDEHIRRIRSEVRPDMASVTDTVNTIARKPSR